MINGQKCSFYHPRSCKKFCSFGSRGPRGCEKGSSCQFFHPIICRFSLRSRRCTREQCTFVHLKGTVREARDPHKNTLPRQAPTTTMPIPPNISEDLNPRNSSFLKLENLLGEMKTSFQQQITRLQHQMDAFLMPSWQAPRQHMFGPPGYGHQTYSPRHPLASPQEATLNYQGMQSPTLNQTMVGHARDLNPRDLNPRSTVQ